MNKIISNILLISIHVLFFGCNIKHDIRLEQNIYNNLFGELIESTITDYRKLIVPSLSDFKDVKSIDNLNKLIEVNKRKKVSPLIIYVNDTIEGLTEIDHIYSKIKLQLSNQDYQSIISNSDNQLKESSTIKLQNLIVNTSKYELKHDSIKLNDTKSLKNTEKERISGTYHLSRIHFNEEKTLGFLTLGLVYGRLNAIGVIVIIKKEDNAWVIKKIIEDWVS